MILSKIRFFKIQLLLIMKQFKKTLSKIFKGFGKGVLLGGQFVGTPKFEVEIYRNETPKVQSFVKNKKR